MPISDFSADLVKFFMDLVPVFPMTAPHSNFNVFSVILARLLINSHQADNSAFEAKMSGLQNPEDAASANILKNLHYLEKFTGEIEEKTEDCDVVGQTVKETAEWTYQTIFSEEVEIALQILDLLVFLNTVGHYHSRNSNLRNFSGTESSLLW